MGHKLQVGPDEYISYDKLLLTTKQDRGTVRVEIWIQDEDVSDCFVIVHDIYDTMGFRLEFDRDCGPEEIKNKIDTHVLEHRVASSMLMMMTLKARGINVRH
jgi:hypothetical protein